MTPEEKKWVEALKDSTSIYSGITSRLISIIEKQEKVVEPEGSQGLRTSCKKLIDYWRRTGPLKFQTEKLHDYFRMIEAALEEMER